MGLRNWLRSFVASKPATEQPSGEGRGIRSWIRSWLNRRDEGRSATESASQTSQTALERSRSILGREPRTKPPVTEPKQERPQSEIPTPLWDVETTWNEGQQQPAEGLSPNQRTALTGEWVQMSSSNVDKIRYLVENKTLEVIFLDGAGYQYYDVPIDVFLDFLTTDSPGRFVWNRLRYWYDYAKVLDATRKSPGRHRNPNVVRRLPSEDDPQEIAREHARRMRTSVTGHRRGAVV